ncbi:MAG TPA: hypothetical protein VFR86_18555 [Burkholderiaceae bacterium]|nr:hypothetical protein [Burkholderiaceae bacterium]
MIDAVAQRVSATRIWVTEITPPIELLNDAARVASTLSGTVGRVLGAGSFENRTVAERLVAHLPGPAANALRSRFEWYGCRGAGFHNDAHYTDVLFGAWCISGPPREVVFSRLGLRAVGSPGAVVIFDPFEPHAVLARGATRYEATSYEGSPASVFLAFEIELAAAVADLFGIGPTPARSASALSSRIAINAETGALASTSEFLR